MARRYRVIKRSHYLARAEDNPLAVRRLFVSLHRNRALYRAALRERGLDTHRERLALDERNATPWWEGW